MWKGLTLQNFLLEAVPFNMEVLTLFSSFFDKKSRRYVALTDFVCWARMELCTEGTKRLPVVNGSSNVQELFLLFFVVSIIF